MIHTGDCLDVMATLPAASVDAVVTDPPYDLTSTGARKGSPRNPGTGPFSRGFMGKAWDGTGIAFRPETWEAALRVAKPGAYLLAFGGTRTVHRMTCAVEDAGWLIRDMLVWAYASGFPKSKALLKPAWEPIVMARKPGPLRELAIDACRIPGAIPSVPQPALNSETGNVYGFQTGEGRNGEMSRSEGRWPANVLLTDPIFDGDMPGVEGAIETTSGHMKPTHVRNERAVYGKDAGDGYRTIETYGDTGTYSRFFLVPKAARSEREPSAGVLPERVVGIWGGDEDDLTPGKKSTIARQNTHPTVKPLRLMRHLVRLVTPAGGTVLDPFLGSGTTAMAAESEGFEWIGIEREPEYVAIAEARLAGLQRPLGLVSVQ